MKFSHKTVFLEEGIKQLNIKPDGIYVDATTGGAGHSELILKQLTTGHLYCFDQDTYALYDAQIKLSQISENFTLINSNFSQLAKALKEYGVTAIDGIIYDLGVSSLQLDMPERGFSYRFDAKLDMRMNIDAGINAEYVVNEYSYNDLVNIFFKYGEEPMSKQIARAIERARKEERIQTTHQLVNIIKSALPNKILSQKGHPAKRIFQAIRIAVNDEIQAFEDSILDALELLKPDARAVVITFHSLEDRACKIIFKEYASENYLKGLPVMPDTEPSYELVNKKPIVPTEEEIRENRRAHSAKMRVIRRK